MSVTKFEILEDTIVIRIDNVLHYGVKDTFEEKVIPKTVEYFNSLGKCPKDKLDNLPDDIYRHLEAELYTVPGFGTLVFFHDYDVDFHASSYRYGSHVTTGPSLLVEKRVEEPDPGSERDHLGDPNDNYGAPRSEKQ